MKEYKYSKRAAAAAMAGLLAVSLAVPAFAAEDVDTAAEAEVEAVMTEDGAMTRGEMLLAMYRALGGEPVEDAEAFTDIDADSELAAAASWGVAEKIVSGYGDGSFGAEDPVTREQAATMLYRYAAAQGKGFQGAWMFLLNYPDADEISEYADEAMHWMVMNEILPDAETGLAPKGNLTRAGLDETV